MKTAWFVVVAFEKKGLPTLLIGPRNSEREANELGSDVRAGAHVPEKLRTRRYQWGVVEVAGIKA